VADRRLFAPDACPRCKRPYKDSEFNPFNPWTTRTGARFLRCDGCGKQICLDPGRQIDDPE
jgi:flavoprotein